MKTSEELVEKPFQRLIAEKKLVAYKYDGFWAAIDTFKDKCRIDAMYNKGDKPWEVWNASNSKIVDSQISVIDAGHSVRKQKDLVL